MNHNSSIKVEKINFNNINAINELYNNFKERSLLDYKFDFEPVPFNEFVKLIGQSFLEGHILFDNNEAKIFSIYTTQLNEAVELNLIYGEESPNLNKYKFELLKQMIPDLGTNWKVVSYPMLGLQENFVKEITHLGFNLIGQAVVKFKLNKPPCINLLSIYKPCELTNEYEMTSWDPRYIDGVIEVIHETFKESGDSRFDPRFTTLKGTKEAVSKVVANEYGVLIPNATKVLLHNDKVIGVCFMVLGSENIVNIPLVGVSKEFKRKGFGCHLLKAAIDTLIFIKEKDNLPIIEINATVDTDNYPAIKMYRNIGFKEEYNYPHAYLKNTES